MLAKLDRRQQSEDTGCQCDTETKRKLYNKRTKVKCFYIFLSSKDQSSFKERCLKVQIPGLAGFSVDLVTHTTIKCINHFSGN